MSIKYKAFCDGAKVHEEKLPFTVDRGTVPKFFSDVVKAMARGDLATVTIPASNKECNFINDITQKSDREMSLELKLFAEE